MQNRKAVHNVACPLGAQAAASIPAIVNWPIIDSLGHAEADASGDER